ncbi:hypothetical protein [Vibrio sp. JZG120]
MLDTSLLMTKHEQALDEQLELFDRQKVFELVWDGAIRLDAQRKHGITERDIRYFTNVLAAIEVLSDEELLDLCSDGKHFRQVMKNNVE